MSTTLGCVNSDSSQWMMNSAGQSPCEVLESVLQVCDASASVPHLSVDVSCGSLGNSTSPCCCSTATYALVSACWVCQTGKLSSLLSNTYQTWWSSCPISSRLNGSLPTVVTRQIVVPRWALITPEWTDTNWNQSSAQLAVGITPTSILSNSITATPTPSSSPSPSPTPSLPPQHNRTLPYAPIAVCSVFGLVLLLGMTAWLCRRRNRISSSSRPPLDFDIDRASSGLIPKHETARPKWVWWKKSGSDRRYESDPGKIDAWRYPFEYEPVSTGSTGSTASGRGTGFYDPYRPQSYPHQPQPHHLAPRSSMDTLAVRNQPNSRNRTPTSGSTQNLRATPSPVPGTTPVQTYTALPQGVSSSSYGYGQPPTYGQAIPYTYPYGQPHPHPVPSSSAGSPMSPQYNHMQSPSQVLHSHSHSHSHPAQPGPSRRGDQVLMIPIDQMSPDQIEQLRLQFPDLRIKQKKRRRRRHGDPETDREHERDTSRARARANTDANANVQRARPRSWSVPAQVQVETGAGEEEEWDGRPRNGVELREKYERRRASREVVVVSVGVGASAVRVEAREEERRGARDERRNSQVRGPRERDRGRERTHARDGGVSLMGGPPPRR
ncbi:hypothetical protein RSOLAG22IIIB_09513 [Rhizoctonia solani]|uniref:Uncharacterized protein n=1 Tax=Rhizoctonia solani TaxID=456999 RepID=A0A0K6FYI6_9AGAM|nr:hypothetical protein RSOLAG22IIIB_09513 [Rhizoctonia solani]